MADHGGQPQNPGTQTFDVTDLRVSIEPSVAPTQIVDGTLPFTLSATFTGSGISWNAIENLGNIRYRAEFFAERIGFGGINLPAVASDQGLLVSGRGTYTIDHIVAASTLIEGLWRLGVVVTFPPLAAGSGFPASPGWPAMLGYYEGLLVQVSDQAL